MRFGFVNPLTHQQGGVVTNPVALAQMQSAAQLAADAQANAAALAAFIAAGGDPVVVGYDARGWPYNAEGQVVIGAPMGPPGTLVVSTGPFGIGWGWWIGGGAVLGVGYLMLRRKT
ncbi:MAG: hypothetical protein ACYC6M_04980 [Terriglobales bacterium]